MMELAAWIGFGLLVAGGSTVLVGAGTHLMSRTNVGGFVMILGSCVLIWGLLVLGALMLADLYGWHVPAGVVALVSGMVVGARLMYRRNEEER